MDRLKGSQQEAHFVSQSLSTSRRNEAFVRRVMFLNEVGYRVREILQYQGSLSPTSFSSQLDTVLQKLKFMFSLEFW